MNSEQFSTCRNIVILPLSLEYSLIFENAEAKIWNSFLEVLNFETLYDVYLPHRNNLWKIPCKVTTSPIYPNNLFWIIPENRLNFQMIFPIDIILLPALLDLPLNISEDVKAILQDNQQRNLATNISLSSLYKVKNLVVLFRHNNEPQDDPNYLGFIDIKHIIDIYGKQIEFAIWNIHKPDNYYADFKLPVNKIGHSKMKFDVELLENHLILRNLNNTRINLSHLGMGQSENFVKDCMQSLITKNIRFKIWIDAQKRPIVTTPNSIDLLETQINDKNHWLFYGGIMLALPTIELDETIKTINKRYKIGAAFHLYIEYDNFAFDNYKALFQSVSIEDYQNSLTSTWRKSFEVSSTTTIDEALAALDALIEQAKYQV